jgi:hypothetical protein
MSPDDPRALPGEQLPKPRGVNDYLVTLRSGAPVRPRSRRGRHQAQREYGAAVQEKVRAWLEEVELQGEVTAIGKPLGLRAFAITCTPRVAEKLRELPEIEAVVLDDDALGTAP